MQKVANVVRRPGKSIEKVILDWTEENESYIHMLL